jgi:hypothetical protein
LLQSATREQGKLGFMGREEGITGMRDRAYTREEDKTVMFE